jgi:hypothetical protein
MHELQMLPENYCHHYLMHVVHVRTKDAAQHLLRCND